MSLKGNPIREDFGYDTFSRFSLPTVNQTFSRKESLCKDLSLKTKIKGSLNLDANDHSQIPQN